MFVGEIGQRHPVSVVIKYRTNNALIVTSAIRLNKISAFGLPLDRRSGNARTAVGQVRKIAESTR